MKKLKFRKYWLSSFCHCHSTKKNFGRQDSLEVFVGSRCQLVWLFWPAEGTWIFVTGSDIVMWLASDIAPNSAFYTWCIAVASLCDVAVHCPKCCIITLDNVAVTVQCHLDVMLRCDEVVTEIRQNPLILHSMKVFKLSLNPIFILFVLLYTYIYLQVEIECT